jgi:dUTP pyrophosphatase
MDTLKVQKVDSFAMIPFKAHESDAGFDLFACPEEVGLGQEVVIQSGSRFLISTGIRVAVPSGYYGRVAARSGLSVKGVDVGAGVVDSGYRGVLKVLLINNTGHNLLVKHGDKIAQLVLEKISPISKAELVESLDETDRGDGGFGSTGG